MSRTKFALLAAFVLAAVPARAVISSVSGSSNCNAPGAVGSFTFGPAGSSSCVGCAQIVVVAIHTNTVTVTSVTDSHSDSYSRQAAVNGNTGRTEIWSTSPTLTISQQSITVNLSAATSKVVGCTGAYDGAAALGTTATGTSLAANPSISLTSQDSNNWCVAGFGGRGAGTFSASIGNLRASAVTSGGSGLANVGGAITDNTVASPGTCTNAVTNADTDWANAALELRTVAASPCPETRMMMGAGC